MYTALAQPQCARRSSHGINGGTAQQITGLIPKVGEELVQNPLGEDEELIVVLMCGLNDWKTIITKFPWGSGPISFKRALRNLLVCMNNQLGNNLRLFIPAIPIGCVDTDPCARSVHLVIRVSVLLRLSNTCCT